MATNVTINSRIAIIGGGPGGLMLARLLSLRGFSPVVFERDLHAGERPQGGSLDLHGDTGQRAMRLAGLEKQFAAAARPEDQGDRLYDQHGTLLYDRDGVGDDRPEIDRTELRRILLESLKPDTLRWGHKIDAVRPGSDDGYDVIVDGATEHFDVVVGADGAWSRVRPLLTDVIPVYEGVTLAELGFDVKRHPDIDALVGSGKMFAVGDNRLLVAQRNGRGHIRGYAGVRLPEAAGQEWMKLTETEIRAELRGWFSGWAPALAAIYESGDLIAVRALYALPIGYTWRSCPGITLLGDAAHLMSPFSGEGVNLALADAVDLAEALMAPQGWEAVAACEAAIMERARDAAEGAAAGLNSAFSPDGPAAVFEHYRERVQG